MYQSLLFESKRSNFFLHYYYAFIVTSTCLFSQINLFFYYLFNINFNVLLFLVFFLQVNCFLPMNEFNEELCKENKIFVKLINA